MKRHSPPFNLREFKIEVTYRCELNCIHCSSDARPSNLLEIGRDDCLCILREARGMGAQDVPFSGGEPLLWPHILDSVEAAARHGLEVTVYTSGNVIGFRQTASSLRALGASRMIFSVFGANAMTHRRITRKTGSFENTIAAIGDALSVGLAVELHFVPMVGNHQELPGVVRLARQLGISKVSLLRLVPQGRAALVRDRILSRIQNEELRHQVLTLKGELGNEFIRTGSPYNFLMVNDSPACCAAIDRMIIGPDLQIYPCDAFKNVGATDLVKTEDRSCLVGTTLLECWQKSPYFEAVRTYLTTDFEPPCVSCGLLEKCVSGCLAQKVIAYNALDKKPDPDCLVHNFKGDAA